MPTPQSNQEPRRKRQAKLNRSSRTKTSHNERKQNKKRISLDDVRQKVKSLCESNELLLPKLFDDQAIESLLQELCPDDTITRRNRIFTLPVTLSLFVQQVLSKDCGCKEVITILNRQRKRDNLSEVSTNTTSYCEARMRLPLPLIAALMRRTADLACANSGSDWRWFGHRVLLVDGLVVHAPDTPANQEAYPQPHSQQPGLGFPQIRVCVSICLASGVVTDIQYGPVEGKKTGEATLFRQMFSKFMPGDIIVADSNFECYRDLAMLKSQGVYMVCNMNGTRTSPFTGECQVIEETIKTLPRPEFDKSRFTRAEWERLTETLDVRIIRYQVRGRKSEVILVTTLLDQQTCPAMEIAKLYKQRWECELDIRSIKTVMGMTWLSCHIPEMLESELMVYFLAYNLVRVSICDAAKVSDRKPRDLSFKNAKDSWLNLTTTDRTENDYAWLLWSIADAPLRKRPGRNEPRKIKRRCSKYEKMKLPRAEEKAALSP